MTDRIKQNENEISKYISSKDFECISQLFTDKKFSVTELLIFYRRNKVILKDKSFWNSQLPHFHLQAVIESDFKITFLENYFSSDLNCNDELNKHIAVVAKSDFIKIIKLWQVFNHNSFYTSLKPIAEYDTDIERFVKEFDIVIKAQQKITDEADRDGKQLLQYSFGEIVMAFTLFYYEFKQSPQALGNKKWQTSVEMTLVDELNNILTLFKGKDVMRFQFESNEEIQKEFQRNEAPHHTLGKQGLWTPLEKKYRLIFSLINRMIDRNSRKGQIKLYLSGYVDFETTILNPAPLRSNNNYRIFKINDNKSAPEELYFWGFKLEDIANYKQQSRTETKSILKNLKFYGISEIVKHNGKEIEIEKVLKLLLFLSVYKGPKERQIISNGEESTSFVMNQGDEKFRELFGSNESITLFDYEKLAKGVMTYFNWSEQETQNILSFLTIDIATSDFPYTWINKPFLKFSNQVLWLGSFLKDRRWGNILLNSLKKGKGSKDIATNFEKQIEELFKKNSFKTISSLRFQSSNGQSGDFDVLAFKDNYLIVCEAKSGIRSDEFDHAAKTEAVRLEGCAADQLEKAIYNIKENWANIKLKLGIPETIEIDNVKIVPLIVTDNFEGDLRLYKNTILKTSLLELEVNLKNKKKELLEMYFFIQSSMNGLNIDFKNSITPSNWDLWKGQKECSVENLIQNIEQNTIWKELENVWKFEDVKILLDY